VPSSFDYRPPGILGPRGTAFYATKFDVEPGRPALINFAACGFYCHVFVDNKSIGDHRAGGYAPFWLTVPPSQSMIRDLFVIVDNRWNDTTAPLHTGGDFYQFGGIHRSVIVHGFPSTSNWYLQRLEVYPTDYKTNLVDLNVVLSNSTYSGNVSLIMIFDSGNSVPVPVVAENGVVKFTKLMIPNGKPWSLQSPNLHTITIILVINNVRVDAIQARFGIRVVSQSDSRITINGEKVKFRGHNRHTLYPEVGPSLTLDNILADVAIIKDLGANIVRGAHYPQDQRFLDICDEVGLIIWEETLGPAVTAKNTQNPYFMKYQVQQINEMISASISHPSIIFWGFFNEGTSNDASMCPGYKECVDAIHARDTTRFATWANDLGLTDQCLRYADVISFNGYPGWYSQSGNSSAPIGFWNDLIANTAEKFSQPILVSEAGCEGLYEWDRNASSVIWGQPYQVVVLTNTIKTILSHPRSSGLTLWVLFDFKGNDGAQGQCGPCDYYPGTHNASYINVECDGKCKLSCRPCGDNHKGTLDYWRRKKLVYEDVKTLFHQPFD